MGWSKPFPLVIKQIKDQLAEVSKEATHELFSRVWQRSPVLTGEFRGDWTFGHNNVPTGRNGVLDPSGSAAEDQAKQVFNFPIGGTMYYVNNSPYGQMLEHGWSREKAPEGMVGITLREFEEIVADAASKNKLK